MNALNDSYHVCLHCYHVRLEKKMQYIYTVNTRVWYRHKA